MARIDPLSDFFAQDYRNGGSFGAIARRYGVTHWRVAQALKRRPGFVKRSPQEARADQQEPMNAVVLAAVRAQRDRAATKAAFASIMAAAGTSSAIHVLRARARIGGPLAADESRIAAAHAAGLTLDDIHEVFAVPPAEAVRAIALHAGR